MKKLTETTSLLYSELQQQCVAVLPIDKGISYSTKLISGRKYWYLELSVGSKKRAMSLGADCEALREQIEKQKRLVQQSKDSVENRQRLVAMLAKGGASIPLAIHGRVLEVLERAGIFLAGGVLIGSHAFSVYGNILGVQWPTAYMKTQDMDVAAANNLPVAVTRSDQPIIDILKEAGMSFCEVPAFDRKSHSTMYSLRNKELYIDLLTPMIGRTSSHPVYLKHLKTYAEPLRFLDYLIEDTIPAVIVANAGIMINIPDPARFAFHKLVVAMRRSAHEHIKANKDRVQAEALLSILIEERKGDVLLALDAAKKMPGKFMLQLREGLDFLESEDIKSVIREIIG